MGKSESIATSLLADLPGLSIYPRSITQDGESFYFLAKEDGPEGKVFGLAGVLPPSDFELTSQVGECAWLGPLSAANAAALRTHLPWLKPRTLGLKPSFGFGDRLGLATPGHILAVQSGGIDSATLAAPVFAQQSVRENARTGRTAQNVLDDAIWGIFQEGWQAPWGADADHIKTSGDLPPFIAAGYTLYTFDPGEYVDSAVENDSVGTLKSKVKELPWQALQSSPEAMYRAYLDLPPFDLGTQNLVFNEVTFLRAAAKYGRAIAHIARLYSDLTVLAGPQMFEVEVSVDETDNPTTIQEHYFFAHELQRLAVRWVSLAPRFLGLFAKGVDYGGNLQAFAKDIEGHAAVARTFGSYKLSLHSGSDKFSIYQIARQSTRGLLHIKTAGTSYLEALRVLASREPAFFRQIMALSTEQFDQDKKSYILATDLQRVPLFSALSDNQLPSLLDEPNTRQVLHVTYGSVLDRYGKKLKNLLSRHETAYDKALQEHFKRHLF